MTLRRGRTLRATRRPFAHRPDLRLSQLMTKISQKGKPSTSRFSVTHIEINSTIITPAYYKILITALTMEIHKPEANDRCLVCLEKLMPSVRRYHQLPETNRHACSQ